MLGVRVPPGLPFDKIAFEDGPLDRIKAVIDIVGQFLRESRSELKKVTWPTPKQTLASTSVVIVVVVVVSLVLGMFDFGLTRIIRLILG
jgi:preprotein translocase subunit SecE